MQNSQISKGSTAFTRDHYLIELLHRHDGSRLSEYVKKVIENNR